MPLFAVSLAPPCTTAGAPDALVGDAGVEAVTADGVLMCGGAPETVGVMLDAACVLLGVVGLVAELEVDAVATVPVDGPLLVLPRSGANVLVESWMMSLP